jgi:hypothetical protein
MQTTAVSVPGRFPTERAPRPATGAPSGGSRSSSMAWVIRQCR